MHQPEPWMPSLNYNVLSPGIGFNTVIVKTGTKNPDTAKHIHNYDINTHTWFGEATLEPCFFITITQATTPGVNGKLPQL